jgi:pimeloyl-ACP methyl ester carboxylesterase
VAGRCCIFCRGVPESDTAGEGTCQVQIVYATYECVAQSFRNEARLDVALSSYQSRWGEVTPDPESEWLQRVILDDVGHFPTREAPQEISALLLELFR